MFYAREREKALDTADLELLNKVEKCFFNPSNTHINSKQVPNVSFVELLVNLPFVNLLSTIDQL